MANYNGTGRTNYVKIRDMDALRATIDRWNIGVEIVEKDGHVAFLGDTGDDFSLPSYCETDEGVEHDDALTLLAGHMEDGQILVAQQSGHEKLRYVDGYARALNN